MTKEQRAVYNVLKRTPIVLTRLYTKKYWTRKPPEVYRAGNENGFFKGPKGARVCGTAFWWPATPQRIALDMGSMVADGASWGGIILTLIEEACHIATHKHFVTQMVYRVWKSRRVLRLAERRLLLAMARKWKW